MKESSGLLTEDLIQKVRRIEITTRKVIDDVMTGRYRSHFKGMGVQFSEHRLYLPGDDIRHIDWKVSARSRDPMIKLYEEERELTVLLVVDVSGSETFGSAERTKLEMAAEIAGMLSYAAIHTGDQVGVLLFSGEVEKIIPPRKGRQHVLRIVRELIGFQAKHPQTNLRNAQSLLRNPHPCKHPIFPHHNALKSHPFAFQNHGGLLRTIV